ncbi:MAG: hypothetical protein PVJ57_03350 [Phycisphaerae bacterium]|jgi:hypothetical protein
MYCIDCGYPLDQLPATRCPECGAAFDEHDATTFADSPRGLQRAPVIAASSSGAALGWAIGHAINTVAYGYDHGFAYGTEGTLLSKPALVTAAWWLVLVLPLLLSSRILRLLRSTVLTPLIGAVWAIAWLWLACGWQIRTSVLFETRVWLSIWAAMVGGGAGLAARLVLRRHSVRAAVGMMPDSVGRLWLLGPGVILAWLAIGWPITCRVAPDFAFRVSSSDTREWVLRRVLKDVHVGDSAESLFSRLPAHYGNSNPPKTHGTWLYTNHSRYVYYVKVQDGVIVELHVFE